MRKHRTPILLGDEDVTISEWIGHMKDYEDPIDFVKAIGREDLEYYDAEASAPFVQRVMLRFSPCNDGEHYDHIDRAKGERGSFWAYAIRVDDLQGGDDA